MVGHSLGGSVALELMHQSKKGALPSQASTLESTTYGAPVVSVTGGNRFRNYGDPVSMFDRGAKSGWHPKPLSSGSLTHDYHNFTHTSAETGDLGYVAPNDGVVLNE